MSAVSVPRSSREGQTQGSSSTSAPGKKRNPRSRTCEVAARKRRGDDPILLRRFVEGSESRMEDFHFDVGAGSSCCVHHLSNKPQSLYGKLLHIVFIEALF